MQVVEQENIEVIKEALLSGEIVAFATETVYGLAVKYDDRKALANLRNLKGRDDKKPFTIMLASSSDIKKFADVSKFEQALVDKYFPGELTIVFNVKKGIDLSLLGSNETVGVRIPGDKFVLDLLKKTGALAVTSANKSGKKACVSYEETVEFLSKENFKGVIVPGKCRSTVASTVIKVEKDKIIVLREGKLKIGGKTDEKSSSS